MSPETRQPIKYSGEGGLMKFYLLLFTILSVISFTSQQAKAECGLGADDCTEDTWGTSGSTTGSGSDPSQPIQDSHEFRHFPKPEENYPVPPKRPGHLSPTSSSAAEIRKEKTAPDDKKSPESKTTAKDDAKKPSESGVDSELESKISAAEQVIAECESQAGSAESACITEKDDWSSTGLSVADAVARGMPNGNFNLSTVSACQNTANAIGALNAVLAGAKVRCSNSYDSCYKACYNEVRKPLNELKSDYKKPFDERWTQAKKQCSSAKTRLANIEQNIAQATTKMQQAQSCVSDVASAQANLIPTLAQCQANPNLQNCNQVLPACSNPNTAANDLACICQNTQGRDPRCGQVNYSATTPNTAGIGSSGAGGAAAFDGSRGISGNSSLGSLADSLNGGSAPNEGPNGLDDKNQGGKNGLNVPSPGGSAAGGGGSHTGANQAKLKQAPQGSPSKINSDVFRGTYGGNSGFNTSGGGYKSDSGSYSRQGSWIPPKVGKNPYSVNIDKFRPNMRLADRTIAGQSVLANGLLAPHVNIWKQVNSRYLQVGQTLAP